MNTVQIKIQKDDKTITYVKIIHEFDKSIPISDIKKRIEQNQFVHEFDLDARDWMYIENMTEYKWHKAYLKFLKKLEDAGAKLEIYLDGRLESIQFLKNWINTMKGISDDCDKYPD